VFERRRHGVDAGDPLFLAHGGSGGTGRQRAPESRYRRARVGTNPVFCAAGRGLRAWGRRLRGVL